MGIFTLVGCGALFGCKKTHTQLPKSQKEIRGSIGVVFLPFGKTCSGPYEPGWCFCSVCLLESQRQKYLQQSMRAAAITPSAAETQQHLARSRHSKRVRPILSCTWCSRALGRSENTIRSQIFCSCCWLEFGLDFSTVETNLTSITTTSAHDC